MAAARGRVYRPLMAITPLVHNPLNGVTAGVWRQADLVRKVITCRREAPAHWAASLDPRHWNYWRREALVYESALPDRLGLAAPRLRSLAPTADGDIEVWLEHVAGRHGTELGIEDLERAAHALGCAQGRAERPAEPWLSVGFLREYSGSRPADWGLLHDDAAWAQPLMGEHFGDALRRDLVRLCERREWLLALMERLPRTVCHLDVWPHNLVARPDGEIVFVDWAFTGDGAIGEDVGNFIVDSVFDLLLAHETLGELDERLTGAYVRGLRAAGWTGDERIARLGICASAVKYDWLTIRSLEQASAPVQHAYGRATTIDAHARYASRAAALALCARWADEAERLSGALAL
jgi:hypothetical protein